MASKITIKRSLTAAAPAGLSFGEMAFVQGSGLTANQLYVGISGGSPVWVGAQIGTTGTWTDNAAKTTLATQDAIEQRIGAKITASTTGVSSFNGVTGAVTGVSSFNGLTGAVSGVTTSVANTFTALQTFSAGISVSGATFTGLISGATATFSKDITVNSITVGRGSGGIDNNVAVGYSALSTNTTGESNVAVGYAALSANTTGSENCAFGHGALNSNTEGYKSVGVGLGALGANTTGNFNIGVGESALGANTTGSNNVGVGNSALYSNTTGSNKTAIGYGAGYYRGSGVSTLTTGTGGIYIGYQARGSTLAQTNEIVIGVDALGLGSNTAVIGATLQSSATIYGLLNLPGGLSTTGATFTGNISAPNIVSSFNGVTGAVTGVGTAVAGTGISVSGATGAVTITNIGVRTFNGATGAVTGVSSFNGLTGAVSGVGSIVAGTGISISGPTGAVTVNSTYVPALATTGVTGVASFNSADFAVSGAGDVTIKAAGVGNAQLENPNITINGALIALGTTYNFKISEFGSASSAELAAKLSDTTGTTGGFVRAIGPTISAPVISSNTIKNSLGIVATIPILDTMSAIGGGDTFVLLTNTQTLTNKTLTGATLTSPSLGTPTLLVGTNITGTASGLTAGRVTTNADLTGAITSVGNGTTLGSFSSAQLATALTDETGSGANVFGTSPAITTSLTTPSTSFDLLNTTATTVNFAGAGLTLNIGNASGTATFGGNVIVNGDFTVQGNTTTLNTTTLNVEDFNITMGLTLTNASQCTGAGIGIGVGTGITFAYDHSSLGWLSSVNMDLASGKVFKIGNASVLSGTTLGSLVVASSLTSVGTITSGTWSGSFGAVSGANLTNLTAGNLSGTIPSGVLANSIVNIGTTGVALNRASAPLVLTGISSIDGSAATVTTAAQPAITSVGTLISLTVSGTLEAGLIDAGTF